MSTDRVIRDGAVLLFRKREVLEAAVEEMAAGGYRVERIDCTSRETVVRDMTPALRWEEVFGYRPDELNLHAFQDALRSTPDADVPKLLLVLTNFDGLHGHSAEAAHGMADVIEYESRNHLLNGHRLVAFIQTDDPNLTLRDLGKRDAIWNQAEWFIASRQ